MPEEPKYFQTSTWWSPEQIELMSSYHDALTRNMRTGWRAVLFGRWPGGRFSRTKFWLSRVGVLRYTRWGPKTHYQEPMIWQGDLNDPLGLYARVRPNPDLGPRRARKYRMSRWQFRWINRKMRDNEWKYGS